MEAHKVLIIQVNRYMNVHGCIQKSPYSIEPSNIIFFHGIFYTLKSIIQHHGINLNEGHYTTMLYFHDKWVHCNGKNVEQNSQPINHNGYLYFYEVITQDEMPRPLLQINNDSITIPKPPQLQHINAKNSHLYSKVDAPNNHTVVRRSTRKHKLLDDWIPHKAAKMQCKGCKKEFINILLH